MRERTMPRGHSAVLSVTRSSHSQVVWRLIKEHTQMRNHFAAHNVTRNLHKKLIWSNMRKNTKKRNHQARFFKKSRLSQLVLLESLIKLFGYWYINLELKCSLRSHVQKSATSKQIHNLSLKFYFWIPFLRSGSVMFKDIWGSSFFEC